MAQARVLQIIGERDATGVAGRSGYGTVQRMVAAARPATGSRQPDALAPLVRYGPKYHANERVTLQPHRFNSRVSLEASLSFTPDEESHADRQHSS
jgi:hypothetical protein